MGFSTINQPFWGTPIYGNPHIAIYHGAVLIVAALRPSPEEWLELGVTPWVKQHRSGEALVFQRKEMDYTWLLFHMLAYPGVQCIQI